MHTSQTIAQSMNDMNIQLLSYRCICNIGWKGDFCETQSHLCENSTLACNIGATCIGLNAEKNPICVCSYGRKGSKCEKGTNFSI